MWIFLKMTKYYLKKERHIDRFLFLFSGTFIIFLVFLQLVSRICPVLISGQLLSTVTTYVHNELVQIVRSKQIGADFFFFFLLLI